MGNKEKGDKSGSGSRTRSRSRSPLRTESPAGSSSTLPPAGDHPTRADFMSMMSEAMSAQFPRLILETSKVVSAQIQSGNEETSRSFTSFSQDMKQLKLRTEEVEAKAKAAVLKSEGGYEGQMITNSICLLPFQP